MSESDILSTILASFKLGQMGNEFLLNGPFSKLRIISLCNLLSLWDKFKIKLDSFSETFV
jgi:hypothetical protein